MLLMPSSWLQQRQAPSVMDYTYRQRNSRLRRLKLKKALLQPRQPWKLSWQPRKAGKQGKAARCSSR